VTDAHPLDSCRLYAFVDAAFLRGRRPERVALQLCEGGADLIQLRAKGMGEDAVRRLAEAVLPVTRRMGVPLILNDHLALAIGMEADGCHLGQEDFCDAGLVSVPQIKPEGRRFLVGLSTHSVAQAERSLAAEPDYIAVGPVYPTGTKPGAKAVTPDTVRWARRHVGIPWFAIGGITLDNVGEVLDAGAVGICVVSAILDSENVTEACQAFKRRISSGR
jgi:thiamine-phosphate pyrophosphorylase